MSTIRKRYLSIRKRRVIPSNNNLINNEVNRRYDLSITISRSIVFLIFEPSTVSWHLWKKSKTHFFPLLNFHSQRYNNLKNSIFYDEIKKNIQRKHFKNLIHRIFKNWKNIQIFRYKFFIDTNFFINASFLKKYKF